MNKENCIFAPLIPRLPCLPVPVGSLHHPRCGGRQRGALLVLLVTRLVPVARQHLSLLTLLQLDLRLLPALRPQLRPQQGAPTGKSHPAHAGQRNPDRHGGHHQQCWGKCYHGGCLEQTDCLVDRLWQRHGYSMLSWDQWWTWTVIRRCNMAKNLLSAGRTDVVQYAMLKWAELSGFG